MGSSELYLIPQTIAKYLINQWGLQIYMLVHLTLIGWIETRSIFLSDVHMLNIYPCTKILAYFMHRVPCGLPKLKGFGFCHYIAALDTPELLENVCTLLALSTVVKIVR
jgi:hypothetical protein